MAEWTLTFTSRSGQTVSVGIRGMEQAKTLTPAEDPFSVTADNSEDPFKPIRSSSGYIRVLALIGELDEVFTSLPSTHPVTARVGNATVWCGFVKGEAYTQGYEGGKITVEIPVVDALTYLEGEYMPNTWNTPVTLGELLNLIVWQFNLNVAEFVFPERTHPNNVLRHYIQPQRWIKELKEANTEGEYFETDTVSKVLTDICVAYGWSLRQEGVTWYFMSIDDGGAYYHSVQVNHQEPIPDTFPELLVSEFTGVLPSGTDHSLSIYQGYRSVTVSNDPGKEVTTLYELNLEDIAASTQRQGVLNQSPHTALVEFDYGRVHDTATCNFYGCDASPLMTKFTTYKNGGAEYTHTPSGSSIEAVQLIRSGDTPTTHVGFSLMPGSTNKAITIAPRWTINTINESYYLNVKATLLKIKSWAEAFDSPLVYDNGGNSDLIHVKIKFGNEYLQVTGIWDYMEQSTILYFDENGHGATRFANLDYTVNSPLRKYAHGALVKLPSGHIGDKLTLEFSVPSNYSNVVGYFLEGLSVELFHEMPYRFVDREGKENTETQFICGGNKEDYSISGGLTCRKGMQRGYGCVLGEPIIDQEEVTDYPYLTSLEGSGKNPEKALCDRLKKFFKSPYRKLDIGVRGNVPKPYQWVVIDDIYYFCVGVSTNYKDETKTIHLIEWK